MNIGKQSKILLVLCLLLGLLTACQARQKKVEFAEKGQQKITLTIAWWGGESRTEYMNRLLDLYERRNPQIQFEILPMEWEGYFDNLSARAASGQMPDLVQMDQMYISSFTENGTLADLKGFIQEGMIDTSQIDEELLQMGKVSGKITGMVVAGMIPAIAYNKAVYEDAGAEIPADNWSWEEYMSTARLIQTKTGKYGGGIIMADDIYPFQYFVREQGEELFDEEGKGLGYQEDQIYIEFVEMMQKMITEETLPGPNRYDEIKGQGYENGLVAKGDAGFMWEWANCGVRLQNVNREIHLCIPPGAEGEEKPLWLKPSAYWSVSESSSHKEEAVKFINWFINSDTANEIILAERGIPVNHKVCGNLKKSGLLSQQQEEMFAYIEKAEKLCGDAPAAAPTGTGQINEVFRDTVYRVLYGQIPVEDAAAEFRRQAEDILTQGE